MLENYQLRYHARVQLGGGIFRSPWLNMLLACAVIPAASALSASLLFVGAMALFVVTGALQYGLARVTVRCARGQNWSVGQVFCGFNEGFVKTLLLHLVQTIFIFLWTLLFIIPGIIKTYSYAMVYYLQQEPGNVNKEPTDLLTESRRMMDGYKFKLFCLDLSFIGWYFLGALCFGIGTFFVTPYHQTARANFYASLCGERNRISSINHSEDYEDYV